ncbi:hypothetical protein LJB99_04550 [Deltaproteobacteria bacterium OttesenSCG-928-K17]|nr:hypothetical protein [Deltaproteobacteria bacterium OttesenSCG-928-K17]
MCKWRGVARFLVVIWAVVFMAACMGRGVKPAPFEIPMESRLILQVPYYATDEYPQAAALAAVMAYNGRPHDAEAVARALGGKPVGPKKLVVFARQAELKADFYNGKPEDIIQAVREDKPLIVKVEAAAGPLKAGDYAVIMGYTPVGPVINSGSINQQIVDWNVFLSGWLAARNLIISIEPL